MRKIIYILGRIAKQLEIMNSNDEKCKHDLERIAEQLEVMNFNNGKCKHDLEELKYYYDDDWNIKGSIAWDKQGKEKTFHFCKKCGQVFVKDRKHIIKEN